MQRTPTLFSERNSDDYSASQEDRDGFKKVKQVGWIPEDWTTARIAELGEVVTGTTPKTKKTHYYDGPYPFVSPGDMGEEMFVKGTEKTLTEAGFEAARPVPAGSVLFVCIGSSIGKVAITTEPVATNQQINAVVPRDSIESKYLYYMLDYHAERIHVLAGVQAVPSINKTTFQNESIPVAPARERVGIVDHLDTWDRAIEQTDALIDRKQTRLHGLRQRLVMGEDRFSKFDEPWSQVKLGDVFSERDETGYEHLDLLAVTMDEGVIPRDELDRRDTSSSDKSGYLRAVPGDLVYNSMRMWQGVSGIAPEEGIVSPAYTVCKPGDTLDPSFVRHLFQHDEIINLFRRYSQGLTSDTLKLRYDHFAQIEVEIPSLAEQTEIAEVLNTAEAEIDQLKQKRDALKQQKKGLMQRLLTGKVRTI
jgi:type I restriction enzyme S subunit